MRERARAHLVGSAEVMRQVVETCLGSILEASEMMTAAFDSGGKLLLCGNGGSAADCQHMATEFTNRLDKKLDRPGMPAIALTTDSSFLTAFANDVGFEGVFERQVQALGTQGDVLIGISTSGNSANVVRALAMARALGIKTVALMGSGGLLAEVGDVVISVPSENTQYIQEAHIAVEHVICELVEHSLYAVELSP